jgi:transposase-like protein
LHTWRSERDDRLTSEQLEELRRLRKENAELRRTNEILKAASRFRPGVRPDPATVMTLVGRLRDRFGVEPILPVLGVSVSTFYGWVARRRRPSPRDIEQVWLTEQIERIHKESGETYGSPKVHAQLRREGIRVSRKRVERLMRQAGLQGAFMRKQALLDPARPGGHAGAGPGQPQLHHRRARPALGCR